MLFVIFQLSQILEEIRNLHGAVAAGDRNIRIDVNPGSFTHVCRSVVCCSTVNVLKFRTFYSIPFLPKFCFLCNNGMANIIDPDQTASSGAF